MDRIASQVVLRCGRPGELSQGDTDTGCLYSSPATVRRRPSVSELQEEAFGHVEACELRGHGWNFTPSPAPELDCCSKCDERQRYCSCEPVQSNDQVSGIPCEQPHSQQDRQAHAADDRLGFPGHGPSSACGTKPVSKELQAYHGQLWMYYSRIRTATAYRNQDDEGKPPPPQIPLELDTVDSDKQITSYFGSDHLAYPGIAVTFPATPLSSPGSFGTAALSSTNGPGTPAQSSRDSMFIEINLPGLSILPTSVLCRDNALVRSSRSSLSTSTNGPGSPVISQLDSLFLDGDVFSMRIFPEGVSAEENAVCEVRRLSFSSGVDTLGMTYSSLGNAQVVNRGVRLRDSLVLLLDGCGQDVRVEHGGPGRILLVFRCRRAGGRFWNSLMELPREWLLRMRRRRWIHG